MGMNVKMAENREMVFRHLFRVLFCLLLEGILRGKTDVVDIDWSTSTTSVDRPRRRRFRGCGRGQRVSYSLPKLMVTLAGLSAGCPLVRPGRQRGMPVTMLKAAVSSVEPADLVTSAP